MFTNVLYVQWCTADIPTLDIDKLKVNLNFNLISYLFIFHNQLKERKELIFFIN